MINGNGTAVRNIVVEQLRPETLHQNWPFIRRGATDIHRKVHHHTHWQVEDLYAALRYPDASHMNLWIVTRNQKALGWVCGELSRDRYGGLEFFIWTAWDIPLRERTPEDDVPGARQQMDEYLRVWAKGQGCTRLTCLSSRHLEVLGWTRGHTSFYVPL